MVVDRQHSRACADTQAHHLPLSRSEKAPADEIAQEARSGTAVGPRVAGQTEAVLRSQQLQLRSSVRWLASGHRLSFSLRRVQ